MKSRAGQAVVEFALVLPVFMVLVSGALEFGRVFSNMHQLTTVARCGARVGCLPGEVEDDVDFAVAGFMEAANLSGHTTTTVVTDPTGETRPGGLIDAQEGDTVTVTVAYPFAPFTGGIVPGLNSTMTLHGRCAFRRE
jgi:Flp pilus assembly protein TadG